MEPLFYEYGKIVFDSGDIYAELIFSNITVIGLSKARFSDIRTHFHDDVFRVEIVDVFVPIMFLEGTLKVNGRMSIFRVAGEGTIINFTYPA